MSLELVGLALVGAIVAFFLFKLFLGVVARAVAIPLALGVGVAIFLLQVHPGLALVAAVVVYMVVGRAVHFSMRLGISLLVLLALAWGAYRYLLQAGMIR